MASPFRATASLVAHVAGAAAGGVLLFQAALFMQIGLLNNFAPPHTSFMRGQELALTQARGGAVAIDHRWVDYEYISRHLKRAVIAAEDANFAEHAGIDVDALEKAYERNKKRGKVVLGGSTITQQLAKNLYLTGARSYVRKAQEFVITFMLEFWCTKERIFEIYLNVVEWGVGVFGAEAASRHYYNLGADKLGPEQAAKLAAMLPNPRFFDRNRTHPQLEWKTDLVLSRMGAVRLPARPAEHGPAKATPKSPAPKPASKPLRQP
jgi:monofunctional biosynthetic peptidoglycan transglycosylase